MHILLPLIQKLFSWLIGLFTAPRSGASGWSIPKTINDVIKGVSTSVTKSAQFFAAIYETQRNNKIAPSVTCCATSVSMVLQSLCLAVYGCTAKLPREFEDIMLADLRDNLAAYRSKAATETGLAYLGGMTFEAIREDMNFWAWYAKSKYGIICKVRFLSPAALFTEIMAGSITTPVASSTARGLTSFGHIVVFRGAYEDATGKYFSVNDPFGTYPYGSRTNGEGVSYNLALWKEKDKFVVFQPIEWPGKVKGA